jgi:hypothetical protein
MVALIQVTNTEIRKNNREENSPVPLFHETGDHNLFKEEKNPSIFTLKQEV